MAVPPPSSISRLPPELAALVIAQNFPSDADLLFLWSSLRHVSHFWRRLVHEFVRKRHLPYSFVTLRLGSSNRFLAIKPWCAL